MNVKLVSISEKPNSQYEIRFEREGKRKKLLIIETRSQIAGTDDFISTFTSGDKEFHQIWKDSGFRKNVCAAIRELKSAEKVAA